MGTSAPGDAWMLGDVMTLPTWTRMHCACGGEKFLRSNMLRWHPSGGTTEEPGGWLCADCLKPVDMADLINRSKLVMKQEELRMLQAEIKATLPTS